MKNKILYLIIAIILSCIIWFTVYSLLIGYFSQPTQQDIHNNMKRVGYS